MSFEITTAIWKHSQYRGGTRMVQLALADWSDGDGRCFPSIAAIASKACLSERQVKRNLKRLATDGAITITEGGGGRGHLNYYRINLPLLTESRETVTSEAANGDTGDTLFPEKGDISSTETVTSEAGNGDIRCIAIRKNRQGTVSGTVNGATAPEGGATVCPDPPEPSLGKKKPASVEEVRSYCRERQNQVDPETFWNYYESNGWRVGRNAMKDWRAAVRTWESNRNGERKHAGKISPEERLQRELAILRQRDAARRAHA